MIILDPTDISDASMTGGPGTYWDAAGVLQTSAANTLRITYDPADLTAPPYALIEGTATNLAKPSEEFENALWSKARLSVTQNLSVAPNGLTAMDKIVEDTTPSQTHPIYQPVAVTLGVTYTLSVFVKKAERSWVRLELSGTAFTGSPGAHFDLVNGTKSINGAATAMSMESVGNDIFRCSVTGVATSTASGNIAVYLMNNDALTVYTGDGVSGLYVWGAQMEVGTATSYIPTTSAAVTRPADIISTTGTFLYSNVPEDDAPAYNVLTVYLAGNQVISNHLVYESKTGTSAAVTMTIASPCVVTWNAHGLALDTPISFSTTGALPTGVVAGTVYYVRAPLVNTFNLAATPGGAAIVTSGTQSGVHTAAASLNYNKAVSDTTYWLPLGATNQRKMVDRYNNTSTERADTILMALTPRQIAQGLYLGALDANEVSVVMQDKAGQILYSQTQSLIISNSASSYFNWFFKRVRRQNYFFTGKMPVYSDTVVTIRIKKAGSTAKCGMCVLGPLIDVGLSLMGVSTEIKDYSSSTFSFDGTSSTVERGYAKLMSVDLLISNDQIDAVQEQLANFRQRPVVWIGSAQYGSVIIYGKYSSFKNVISYPNHSLMSLNVQGTV